MQIRNDIEKKINGHFKEAKLKVTRGARQFWNGAPRGANGQNIRLLEGGRQFMFWYNKEERTEDEWRVRPLIPSLKSIISENFSVKKCLYIFRIDYPLYHHNVVFSSCCTEILQCEDYTEQGSSPAWSYYVQSPVSAQDDETCIRMNLAGNVIVYWDQPSAPRKLQST